MNRDFYVIGARLQYWVALGVAAFLWVRTWLGSFA